MDHFNPAEWLARWQEAGGAFVLQPGHIAPLEPVDNLDAVSARTHLRHELRATERRAALRSFVQGRTS